MILIFSVAIPGGICTRATTNPNENCYGSTLSLLIFQRSQNAIVFRGKKNGKIPSSTLEDSGAAGLQNPKMASPNSLRIQQLRALRGPGLSHTTWPWLILMFPKVTILWGTIRGHVNRKRELRLVPCCEISEVLDSNKREILSHHATTRSWSQHWGEALLEWRKASLFAIWVCHHVFHEKTHPSGQSLLAGGHKEVAKGLFSGDVPRISRSARPTVGDASKWPWKMCIRMKVISDEKPAQWDIYIPYTYIYIYTYI